ncbi:MAG: hypothetical protein NT159_07055 [Proteobacteria bacterium]|nr:hypothetical protein [Pseudomonadota bacterium]
MNRKPSRAIKMGSFHVRFEKTTLDDVRKTVGIGDIAHQGDAGASINWVCYTNVNQARVERIWIISDGEMGGPERRVTGISAEILPNGIATTDCPALHAGMKPLVLDSGLWIGASGSFIDTRFGAPSYHQGPWISFDYQGKAKGRCEGGFNVLNDLLLRLENGRVSFLHARQLTSC